MYVLHTILTCRICYICYDFKKPDHHMVGVSSNNAIIFVLFIMEMMHVFGNG